MYRAFIATIIGLYLLLLSVESFASNTAIQSGEHHGPHGGKVIESNGIKFEIAINRQKKLVDVYTLQPTEKNIPKELDLKLGQKNKVHLKAVTPWRGLPHFQGSLPSSSVLHPAENSQKAFAIEFGIQK